MIDKETLILAAKALGKKLKVMPWLSGDEAMIGSGIDWTPWNPLTSNNDCFCLETALGMSPIWYDDRVAYQNHGVWVSEAFADHNGDKDKARRYASTKAAALIKG